MRPRPTRQRPKEKLAPNPSLRSLSVSLLPRRRDSFLTPHPSPLRACSLLISRGGPGGQSPPPVSSSLAPTPPPPPPEPATAAAGAARGGQGEGPRGRNGVQKSEGSGELKPATLGKNAAPRAGPPSTAPLGQNRSLPRRISFPLFLLFVLSPAVGFQDS